MFTGQKLRKVTKSQTQTLELISNSVYKIQGTQHGSRRTVLWFGLLSVHCCASCCFKLKQWGDVSSMTVAEVCESCVLQCVRQFLISPSCDDKMVEGTVRPFTSPGRCHNWLHRLERRTQDITDLTKTRFVNRRCNSQCFMSLNYYRGLTNSLL